MVQTTIIRQAAKRIPLIRFRNGANANLSTSDSVSNQHQSTAPSTSSNTASSVKSYQAVILPIIFINNILLMKLTKIA